DEKAKPYPASPSGMTGVQTLVPLMLDHVNAGKLSLARFVDLTSAGPNRLFGIANKGRIADGDDADFTIVDLKRRATITNAKVGSRAGWTPSDRVGVRGWPHGTPAPGARGTGGGGGGVGGGGGGGPRGACEGGGFVGGVEAVEGGGGVGALSPPSGDEGPHAPGTGDQFPDTKTRRPPSRRMPTRKKLCEPAAS